MDDFDEFQRLVGEDMDQLDTNVRDLARQLAEITDLSPAGLTKSFAGLTLDTLLRALRTRSERIIHERSRITAGGEEASDAVCRLYGVR